MFTHDAPIPARLLAFVLALLLLGFAIAPATATEDDEQPEGLFAPAPSFIDPTCDLNMRGFHRPDRDFEPPVENMTYFVKDVPLKGSAIRYIVTVEAHDGYEITSYEETDDFNAKKQAWVHDYPPFPICEEDEDNADDPKPPVSQPGDDADDVLSLPNTGGTFLQRLLFSVLGPLR